MNTATNNAGQARDEILQVQGLRSGHGQSYGEKQGKGSVVVH